MATFKGLRIAVGGIQKWIRQNFYPDFSVRWGEKWKKYFRGRLRCEISAFLEVESALEKQSREDFLCTRHWRRLHKGGGIWGGSLAYTLKGSIYASRRKWFQFWRGAFRFSLTLKSWQRNCNKQIYFLQKESTQTPWHSHSTYFTHGIFYVWESRLGNGSNTQGPQNIYVGKCT